MLVIQYLISLAHRPLTRSVKCAAADSRGGTRTKERWLVPGRYAVAVRPFEHGDLVANPRTRCRVTKAGVCPVPGGGAGELETSNGGMRDQLCGGLRGLREPGAPPGHPVRPAHPRPPPPRA